jgi:hypothetical protein
LPQLRPNRSKKRPYQKENGARKLIYRMIFLDQRASRTLAELKGSLPMILMMEEPMGASLCLPIQEQILWHKL